MAIVLNDYHVHSCWAFHLGSKFLQTRGSWTLIYMNPFSSLLLVRVHLVFSVYKGVQFHIDPCTSFRILVKSLIREPYQPRTYQQRSHSPHHLSTRTPIHTLKSYSELTKSTQPIRATHTKPPTNYTPNTQSHTTKSLTMITWNACHISSSLPCIMETIQAYPFPPPPQPSYTYKKPNSKIQIYPVHRHQICWLQNYIQQHMCMKTPHSVHPNLRRITHNDPQIYKLNKYFPLNRKDLLTNIRATGTIT